MFVAGLYLLRRSVGTAATVLGALAWPTLVLLFAAVFLPTLAPLLAWPLVAALGAFTLLHTHCGKQQSPGVRLLVLLAGLAPAASLLPPALRDAFVSGQWNGTAMLLDKFDEVRAVANRLPYVSGF